MSRPLTPNDTRATERLEGDEIHIWWIPHAREEGRAPLLAILGRYLGVAGGDIILEIGAHGRPTLPPAQDPTLDFNWSHSASHAVVAIGRRVSLGVDVERRHDRANAMALATRYFAESETALLATLSGAARSAAFLDLWTAKEAVLKATGRGLAFGLDQLTIDCMPSRLSLRRLGDDNVADWQLQRLSLHSDYVAALAWRGSPRQIRLRSF
ncbi:MAG: 4'-phosphopantetheinyl transferase superfamily protein [Rhodanobacter sp.]